MFYLTMQALKIAHQCLLEEKDECISQLQRQVENLQVVCDNNDYSQLRDNYE